LSFIVQRFIVWIDAAIVAIERLGRCAPAATIAGVQRLPQRPVNEPDIRAMGIFIFAAAE
jgi:hypothetical protein